MLLLGSLPTPFQIEVMNSIWDTGSSCFLIPLYLSDSRSNGLQFIALFSSMCVCAEIWKEKTSDSSSISVYVWVSVEIRQQESSMAEITMSFACCFCFLLCYSEKKNLDVRLHKLYNIKRGCFWPSTFNWIFFIFWYWDKMIFLKMETMSLIQLCQAMV